MVTEYTLRNEKFLLLGLAKLNSFSWQAEVFLGSRSQGCHIKSWDKHETTCAHKEMQISTCASRETQCSLTLNQLEVSITFLTIVNMTILTIVNIANLSENKYENVRVVCLRASCHVLRQTCLAVPSSLSPPHSMDPSRSDGCRRRLALSRVHHRPD